MAKKSTKANRPTRRMHSSALLMTIATIAIAASIGYVSWRWLSRTREHWVIFIHGTVHPEVGLLTPLSTWYDDLDTESNSYRERVTAVRSNPLTLEDQCAQDTGLHRVDPLLFAKFAANVVTNEHVNRGVTFLAPLFYAIAHLVAPTNAPTRYYTYGWLGLMSNEYRKQTGFALYSALCDEIGQMRNKPDITIVAHSHGGNVALWFAQAEQERERLLRIEQLVLFGTPVHQSTAEHARSDVFENIISFYSDGDWIQGNDIFSSPERTCKKRLHDWYALETDRSAPQNRYDVRLIADKRKHIVDHRNMWFMSSSNSIADWLWPLPLFVLTPIFIDIINNTEQIPVHVDLHIDTTQNGVRLQVIGQETQESLHISQYNAQLRGLIRKTQELVNQFWQPTYQQKNTQLLTQKRRSVLWSTFFG